MTKEISKSYYAIIPANVRYDNDLTPNAKLLYGEITALCNEKGYCWAGNTYFSDLYKVSNKSVSRWVNQLVEKGYILSEMEYKQGSKEIASRHLRIVQTQIIYTPMDKNVHTYGQDSPYPMDKKVKDNTTVNNTNNKIPSPTVSVDSDFDKLWALYPRKEGKKAALKKYKEVIKKGTATNKQIQDGIVAYKRHLKAEGIEAKYIKQGGTYFNGECWNDEYETKMVQERGHLETMKGDDEDFAEYRRIQELAARNRAESD